jgi:hypothetical protein
MADENKPAFYPRVGRTIAKNFRSAQPPAFIEDPRAMDLPQYGDVDLSVPTKENLEMARRMAERDAQLKRQQEADRSPLEKLAGGVQAGRLMGSALTQGINSIPTRLAYGDEAADKFMQERLYKPEQPLAYEYAQDVGDFLEKLETEYKIPPLMPEAVALQYLSGPATSQATRAAGKGVEQAGMALERRMEPVVKGALERGGLPREMVMAMGDNTQSNVIKPYGGNWLGGGEKLGIPENDLRRLKTSTFVGETPAERIPKHEELLKDPTLSQDQRDRVQRMLDVTKGEAAVDKWIDSNLTNYVKKEMGTRDDPVRKLAEEGIIHTPLREDLDRMDYLKALRKAEGYPAEGMGKSELAKQWEALSDDSIRVTKAGAIQDQANTGAKLKKARAELNAHKKQIDEDFIALLKDKGGLSDKDREVFDKMPNFQKAEILGDTKYRQLQGNVNDLLAREVGFEKRAGELNPFVAKLDPNTRLYSGSTYDLGFDHIVDVLKEDVAAGRIRPEQLNKVSMDQAVRRTYEYDQELARKMNEARMTSRAELPVYKKYPEGLKWVELNRPGDFAAESDAMGHSVRGYEPPEGSPDWTKASGDSGYGGYGLGGWNAIKRGDAKVYSLVDAKGEPHVTIEVGAFKGQLRPDDLIPYKEAALEEAKLLPNGYTNADLRDIEIRMAMENKPAFINQIKGKQNAKPKEEYLPFVQDFVRGGNWSDVRDFNNTNLISADQIRKAGWDMKGNKQKYFTWQEFENLKGAEQKKVEGDGMKRGGKVSISNNPDTMMLEVNNQKMKNGEPAYAGAGSVIKQGLKAAKPEVLKASEALGKIEGRPLKITQADRTKVGGGYLGGPGFSGLQLTEPEYRAAEAAWAVQNAGTAKTILGGGGDNAVYAGMLGTPTQHQSNQMVFDKLLGDFKKAAKRGELTPELRDLINMRLASAVDNKGNPVFPADVDIMDKKFRDIADTFSRRSIAGHLMGGVQVGGKKGQIIDYDKIIRSTTDPDLLDQPTGALGNRLFTLSGGIIDRPDLHPAFPTILQGEDLGVMFTPVERDIVMKDFVEKTMREKGRKPGYMDYTRGNPPTQLITEDILTELQKLGKKKGGAVHKASGGAISGDNLILEERPL